MPQVLSQGNCQYTVCSTTGTQTINPGQAWGPPTQPCVLFGASCNGTSTATGAGLTLVDILPPTTQGGTSAGTNTLLSISGTAVAGPVAAGLQGVGVRVKGALVAINTGGVYNALWD